LGPIKIGFNCAGNVNWMFTLKRARVPDTAHVIARAGGRSRFFHGIAFDQSLDAPPSRGMTICG
jgi:hypothetical protein